MAGGRPRTVEINPFFLELMDKKELSDLDEVADACGQKYTTVRAYATGRTKTGGFEIVSALAELFEVEPADLDRGMKAGRVIASPEFKQALGTLQLMEKKYAISTAVDFKQSNVVSMKGKSPNPKMRSGDIPESFWNLIHAAGCKSVYELSNKVGATTGTLRHYYKGRSLPTGEILIKLAKATGWDASDILNLIKEIRQARVVDDRATLGNNERTSQNTGLEINPVENQRFLLAS